jgi:hypothetical protein
LRVIDPRGLPFEGDASIYGDARYDLAKLAHSVIGRYDFLVCGRYRLERSAERDFELYLPDDAFIREAELEFRRTAFAGRHTDDPAVAALTAMLFLSMLPLHADDPARQAALLANGLRLFAEFDKRSGA